jgi:hypothetical protein
VYITGKKAGSMVVMAQPRKGIVHGSFPLDDALEAASIGGADVNRAVNSIQASITVTITKVGRSEIRWCTPVIADHNCTS